MNRRLRAGASLQPVSGRRRAVNFVAVARRVAVGAEGWTIPAPIDEFQQEFASFDEGTKTIISQAVEGQVFQVGLSAVLARAWWEGRVVLLGDAAHPMLPFLGKVPPTARGCDDPDPLPDEAIRARSRPSHFISARAAARPASSPSRRPGAATAIWASPPQTACKARTRPAIRLRRGLWAARRLILPARHLGRRAPPKNRSEQISPRYRPSIRRSLSASLFPGIDRMWSTGAVFQGTGSQCPLPHVQSRTSAIR